MNRLDKSWGLEEGNVEFQKRNCPVKNCILTSQRQLLGSIWNYVPFFLWMTVLFDRLQENSSFWCHNGFCGQIRWWNVHWNNAQQKESQFQICGLYWGSTSTRNYFLLWFWLLVQLDNESIWKKWLENFTWIFQSKKLTWSKICEEEL